MPGEPRCCQTVWSKGCYDDPKWLVNSSTTCVLMLSHLWSWSKVCNLQALRHPRLVSFIGAMEPTGWWWNMVKLVARWCLLPPNLHCRGCALKIPSLMNAWALVGSTIWGDDLQWKTLTNFTHHKTWITTGYYGQLDHKWIKWELTVHFVPWQIVPLGDWVHAKWVPASIAELRQRIRWLCAVWGSILG